MLVFLKGGLLCPFFTSIESLLIRNLLFELLNLIESSDQTVFEVLLDVGGNDFDVVVRIIHLAVVQFILYKVRQFLIIILTV